MLPDADADADTGPELPEGPAEGTGAALHALAARLFPICRSITGDGVRQSLSILREWADIRFIDVSSGMQVFDWTVPDEWNIRDAYIARAGGERVVDFRVNNLHVLNYSIPVRGRFTMAELRPRLHTLPDQPDLIPYRTSYYNPNWGFCLSQRQLDAMGDGPFDVVIDSSVAPGSLTMGEIVIPGAIEDEILVSTHVCHPSLANDNLSGLVIAAALAGRATRAPLRHTLRILFVPGTIGSITWLALNEHIVPRIRHGLVLTGLGDRGAFTYKRSRRGDAVVDRAARHVLADRHPGSGVIDFSPWGYDERQYCSPGFDLPVGRLSRSPHGEFPEYHTSADDLDFITPAALGEALAAVEAILSVADRDATYRATAPKGEPRLGKRGLYRTTAGQGGAVPDELAMLWMLNQSDGSRSTLDIADRAKLPFEAIHGAATALSGVGLLDRLPAATG